MWRENDFFVLVLMGADLNLDITSANQNNSQIENLKSILLQFVEIIHHGKHDNDNK